MVEMQHLMLIMSGLVEFYSCTELAIDSVGITSILCVGVYIDKKCTSSSDQCRVSTDWINVKLVVLVMQ